MSLPKIVQERLVKEIRFAANMMYAEENPFRKLYFFSAIYGEIGRALNWSWDRELALIHNTIRQAHLQISGRFRTSPQERAMPFPDIVFERLASVAQDLADYIESPKDKEVLCNLMGRVAELEYAMTGNGNYLMEKGLLKL